MRKIVGKTVTLAAAGLLFIMPAAFAQEEADQQRTPAPQERTLPQQERTLPQEETTVPQTQPQTAESERADQARTATTGDKLSRGERKFLSKAAQGGMAEVQLGQLAQEKAASDEVKQIGEKLVEDHSQANDQVQQIAMAKGVDLPKDISGKHKSAVKRLSKLSGQEFDREFLRYQLEHHREDIREFEKTADKAENPEVKEFASNALPLLKKHQDMVAQAAQAAGIPIEREGTADRMRDEQQRQSDPTLDFPQRRGDPSQDPRQRPMDPAQQPQQRQYPETTPPIVP